MKLLSQIAMAIVLLPLLVQGQQNLVPNGNIEYHDSFPENINIITIASPWMSTGFTPDYFHENCPPIDSYTYCGVPNNDRGYQYARSGVAYAGIHAFSTNALSGREFLQIELAHPIVAGIRYEVSYHVSLADKMRYAVRTMGAHFRHSQLHWNEYSIVDLEIEPQIVNQLSSPLSNKDEWIEVSDTFSSRIGGERFMILGNLNLDASCDTLLLNSGEHDHSYYYIDDVSVIALDSIPNSIAEPVTEPALSLTAWPNPATSLLHIRSGLPLARLRLLDLSGRAVHAQEAQGTTHTIPLHTLPAGLYLLEAEDTTGRKAVQRVVK